MPATGYERELERQHPESPFETPRAALARVRSLSCYQALRVVIWAMVLPFYAAGMIGIVGGFFGKIENLAPLVGIVLGCAIILVTLACHQAMVLLADIADLLIELVRKK